MATTISRLSSKRVSEGSSRYSNFDDVTFEHICLLQANENDKKTNGSRRAPCLPILLVSDKHPSAKKQFPSSDAIRREAQRHKLTNYWFIIHPYSNFKFYWSSLMAFIFYLLFLLIPFTYAFHRDLGTEKICITIGTILNTLCIFDLFFNFFTGYKTKYGNFIVLHHGSIIQNYLYGSFWIDFLSTLPLDALYRLYFDVNECNESRFGIELSIVMFHLTFLMKCLRFASAGKMFRGFKDLMKAIKLNYVSTVIILLMLRTVLFIQLCLCFYKAVASSVFFYFFSEKERGKDISMLLDPKVGLWTKYLYLLDFVIWSLFDTSFGKDTDAFIPGKLVTAICMIIGVGYNIYMLIQILNIMNTIQAPRTKFNEMMNQLDAYMQMKQFPSRLQSRLRFFYMKKFRGFYYREEEILGILSEPLGREILINTGQLFVERTQLFKNIPKKLVSKIAGSCKREQFLPNDLISKAGSIGDCMFFIASGTVCVTTTNGRELCHLVDGDYFGEVALILKNNKRIATVTAIEFCEIYILDIASFKKYAQINEAIMQKLTETANERMKATLRAEEEHKKQLHEKIARESFAD